jgi:hypothetical protein
LADLFRLPGPTARATLHARSAFGQPAGESSRVDNGNDLLDLRAESLAEFQELGSFRRRHVNPFGEFGAKDTIFGLKILDDLDKFVLRGACQEHQEGVDKPLHVGTMRKSLVELEVAYL